MIYVCSEFTLVLAISYALPKTNIFAPAKSMVGFPFATAFWQVRTVKLPGFCHGFAMSGPPTDPLLGGSSQLVSS